LAIKGIEFSFFVRELNDFSWAHESEIERIEEKNNVFSFELLKRDLLEFFVPVKATMVPDHESKKLDEFWEKEHGK
jgi:general stress protein 26